MPICAPRNRRVFQIEADLRAGIEAEEALGEIAEVAVAQRAQEAMRQAERHLVFRQSQIGVAAWRRRSPAANRSDRDPDRRPARTRLTTRPRQARGRAVIEPHESGKGWSLVSAQRALLAATTSIPFMSSWPSPQYSEQRIGNSPAAAATNSIVTGSPPRGTFLVDLEFLDLDAVHAVAGGDHELDALALGDFDAGRFKGESLRHDVDRRVAQKPRRGPAG